MELDHLNTKQVHNAARFWAAAEATARGHRVEVVGASSRLDVDGRIVHVISRRQPGAPWQTRVDRPVLPSAHAVIFVDLTGQAPDFYIAPAAEVADEVTRRHEEWLAAQVGGVRPRNPQSTHTAVRPDQIERWHRRWDVLRPDSADPSHDHPSSSA